MRVLNARTRHVRPCALARGRVQLHELAHVPALALDVRVLAHGHVRAHVHFGACLRMLARACPWGKRECTSSRPGMEDEMDESLDEMIRPCLPMKASRK